MSKLFRLYDGTTKTLPLMQLDLFWLKGDKSLIFALVLKLQKIQGNRKLTVE